MQRFKVTSTAPDAYRASRTEPVIQNGRQTAVREIEKVFQTGKASDGRDDFLYDFRFEPRTIVVGDIISGVESTRNPGTLDDIFVDTPAPGSQNRVALNAAPPVERILPLPKPKDEPKPEPVDILKIAVQSGHELTGADLRELCARFLALERQFHASQR